MDILDTYWYEKKSTRQMYHCTRDRAHDP